MKPSGRLLLCASLLAACGHSQLSSLKTIGDAASITRRDDGAYDVVCRDGRREVATAAQVQTNDVCQPTPVPPPGMHRASGQDRTYWIPVGSNKVIDVFGRSLWEGYLSFNVAVAYVYGSESAAVVDGAGRTWSIGAGSSQTFSRLVLPVKIEGSAPRASASISATKIVYEVTKVNPIVGSPYHGKADVGQTIDTIGGDIANVKTQFLASAHFYSNFTNGNGCSRVLITGNDGQTAILDGQHPQVNAQLLAPLTISLSPTCQSSRLTTPENPSDDYDLSIPLIQLGDPV